MSELGKNKNLALICEYVGCEKNCPKDCSSCAIAIKANADTALLKYKLREAIRYYKRALFLEPRFAEAWYSLGIAYVKLNEPINALNAFDRAISIDNRYGKAMLEKARMLQTLGRLDDAMLQANEILDLYSCEDVISLKKELVALGVEDTHYLADNKAFMEQLDDYGNELAEDNDLLNNEEFYDVIEECGDAYQPDDFIVKVKNYCKRKYASLGEEKTRGEYIITSFYGAICATLFYSQDDSIYDDIEQFEYLIDHIDLEFADINAERMLQIEADEDTAECIWEIISPYVTFSQNIFSKTSKLTDELILCAMRNAYELGMLTANYYISDKDMKHGLVTRAEIDAALEKLAESQGEYREPPEISAMCYSISAPKEVKIECKCDKCGTSFFLTVEKGQENLIYKYQELAKEFVELGHKATLTVVCESCANKYYPSASSYSINHLVFSFTAKGVSTPVDSFPSHHYYMPTDYETALSFLRGAETISDISSDTHTHFNSKTYFYHIKEVLGVTPKRGK